MATVLSIDDDVNLQDLLNTFLGKRGHTVETCFSGEDGLVKAAGLRPDVILTDLMLPGLNGVEVIKLLKTDEALRGIPVIVVTAYSAEAPFNESGVRAAGAVEFLQKPIDYGRLADIIDGIVKGRKP